LAANHLWNATARKIELQAARNEVVAFQILLRGDIEAGSITPEFTFAGSAGKTIRAEIGRYYPVASKHGPMPDPLVPLSFTGPDSAKIKHHSLHMEFHVPHGVEPGDYSGALTLTVPNAGRRAARADERTLNLAVSLKVWNFTLPDHLS